MDELENKTRELNQAMDDVARDSMMLGDQFEKTAKQSKTAEERLQDFARTTRDVSRQFGRIGRDFDQQKGKVGAFGSTVELAAMAGAGLAKKFGVAGAAADLAADALMAVANITFEEVDRTIENFDKIGKVGAISAGGLEDFRTTSHRARLTMEQFADVVSKSASSLAIATGNTLQGSRAISQLAEAAGADGLRLQLSNLGISVTEQSEYFADYLLIQRRLGRQTIGDYRNQSRAAGEYVKQLVTLAGLTGQSVDEAKRSLDDQLRNTRFRAAMQDMEARTGQSSIALQAEIQAIAARLPGVADGLRDAFSGANTDAAREAFATFSAVPGGLGALIESAKSGQLQVGQFSRALFEAGRAQREAFGPRTLGAIAGTGAGLENFAATLVDINLLSDINPETIARYTESLESLASGSSEMTNNLKQASLNSQDAAVALESTKDIFLGIGDAVLGPFTNAIKGATEALNGMSKFVFELDKRAVGGPVTGGQPYLVGEEGPEIFSPGASGQITNADITSRLAAIAQGSQYMGHPGGDREGLGYGTMQLVEGLKQTFMPGIGNVAQYSTGNIKRTIIETLDGALEEYTSYTVPGGLTASMAKIGDQMYGDARFQGGKSGESTFGSISAIDMSTGYQQVGGPRSYYDSIMSGVNPLKDAITKNKITETTTTGQAQNDKLLQMQEIMLGVLQQVANNTKSGADTSKQLLRSTAG